MEEGLSCERQFETVHNKISGSLESLKQLKNILAQSALSNVHRALVESHMGYGDVIWGSLPSSEMESLQQIQDRAISMIHASRIKGNWSPNLLTVKQLITFDSAVFVYNIFNRLCPENVWNKFHLKSHYSR